MRKEEASLVNIDMNQYQQLDLPLIQSHNLVEQNELDFIMYFIGSSVCNWPAVLHMVYLGC